MKTLDFDFYFDLQLFADGDPSNDEGDDGETPTEPETPTYDASAIDSLAALNSFINSGKLKENVTITGTVTLTGTLDLSTENLDGHTITCSGNGKIVTGANVLTIGTEVITPGTGNSVDVKVSNSAVSSITGLASGKTLIYQKGDADAKTFTGGINVDTTNDSNKIVYGIGDTTNLINVTSTANNLFYITGFGDTTPDAANFTINETTVKVQKAALTASKKSLTINGNYMLGFFAEGDENTKYVDGTPLTSAWTRDGSSATYGGQDIWKLSSNSKTITYTAQENMVTITGLVNPSTITNDMLNGNLTVTAPTSSAAGKVTLKKSETPLESGFTVSTANYIVALGGTGETEAKAPELTTASIKAQALDANAGSVKVTGNYTAGYYTNAATNPTTITYSAAKTGETLATITGLTGVANKVEDEVITGVNGIAVDQSTGALTIKRDLLRTTGVAAILTNNNKPDGTANTFTLAIGTNDADTNKTKVQTGTTAEDGTYSVAAPTAVNIWEVNDAGTVATYKNVTPAYYALNKENTQINYTAQQNTANGIHGVISGLQAQLGATEAETYTGKLVAFGDGTKIGVQKTAKTGGAVTNPAEDATSLITVTPGTGEDEGKYTFEIAKDALPMPSTAGQTATVTLTNAEGSKLALGGDATAQSITAAKNKWTIGGGTATLASTISDGYKLINDTTIKSAKGGDNQTLLTITGLGTLTTNTTEAGNKVGTGAGDAFAEGITVDSTTVTLKKNVLTNKDVKITSGTDSFPYELKLDTTTEGKKVTTTTDDTETDGDQATLITGTKPAKVKVWAINNGTATYKEVTPEYWAKDPNTGVIKYFRQSDEVILATITGLNKSAIDGEKIEVSDDGTKLVVKKAADNILDAVAVSDATANGATFTISKCALTNANVTLTNAAGKTYTLATKTGVTDEATKADLNVEGQKASAKWWTVSNGTAILHAQTLEGYKAVTPAAGNPTTQIRYYASSADKTLATVTGLSNDVKALKADGSAAATDTLDNKKLGVKLGIADATTPANSIIAHTADLATSANTIKLTEEMLKKTTVTLRDTDTNDGDTFSLAFDATNNNTAGNDNKGTAVTQKSTTGRTNFKEWKVSGTTATYVKYDKGFYTRKKADGTAAGDADASTSITYTADGAQTKLFTVAGLAGGKTYKVSTDGQKVQVNEGSPAADVDYLTYTTASKEISVTNGAVGTTANRGVTLTINDTTNYNTAKLVASTVEGKFTAVAYAANPTWSMSGTTATLTKTNTTDGIEISSDGKSATYRSANIPMLQITGLKSGLDENGADATAKSNKIAEKLTYTVATDDPVANAKVTLNKNALTTSNVNLRSLDGNTYELALDNDGDDAVPTSATEGTRWVVSNSGGTATVVAKNGKSDYYELNETTKTAVTYKREVLEAAPLFTITGLNATNVTKAALEAADQTLITFADGKVTLGANALPEALADGATDEQKAAVNGKQIVLTGKNYVFADTNITKPVYNTNAVTWEKLGANDAAKTSANTATLATALTTAGYEFSADNKKITRVTVAPTLVTINGVRNLSAANMNGTTTTATDNDGYFTVNQDTKTITVKKDALGTLNLSLTGNDYGYKFALDGDVQTTAPTSEESFFEVVASGSTTTAYYRNAKPAYYTLINNDTAVSYHRATGVTTPITITGLKAGLTAADVAQYVEVSEYAGTDDKYAVTLKHNDSGSYSDLLDTADVVLKGDSKYKLSLQSEAAKKTDTAWTWTYNSAKGTLTITAAYETAGYVTKNGKVVHVNANETFTYATISGLKKGVTNVGTAGANSDYSLTHDQAKALFGDGTNALIDGGTNLVLTFKDGTLLGTTNISVTGDYGLKLAVADGVNSSNETENKWFVSGTTATYKNVKPKSYVASADGSRINYTAESSGTVLATVRGIQSHTAAQGAWSNDTEDDGSRSNLQFTPTGGSAANAITVDDNKVITLSSNALTTSNVALSTTGDYTLALAGDVTAPALSNYTWEQKANATNAVVKANMAAGHTLTNDKLVTYSKENSNEIIATISGLKKNSTGSAITQTGETWAAFKTAVNNANKGVEIKTNYDTGEDTIFSLSDSILNKTKVSIAYGKGHEGYTLALGDEQVTTANSAMWSFANGTATYKTADPAYYVEAEDGKSISFHAETKGQTKLIITGLATDLQAKRNGLQEQVIMDSGGTSQVITLNDTNKTIDIKKAALTDKDVKLTIQNPYTGHTALALDSSDSGFTGDDIISVEDSEPIWEKGSAANTAVFVTNYSKGYKVIDSGKTIHKYTSVAGETKTVEGKTYAGQTVYATLTGVDLSGATSGSEAEYITSNISVDGSTISVMNGLLGTSNVTLKNGTQNYTLALGSDVETETAATQDIADQWAVQSKGVAVFKSVKPEYYTVSGNTITYNKATDQKTYVTVSGLKDNISASNGIISGIDLSDNVITLTGGDNGVLTSKNVTMKKGAGATTDYVFALNSVNAPTDSKTWSYESTTGTASLTANITEDGAGYSLSGDAQTVQYSAANASSVLVKITGLKKENITPDDVAATGTANSIPGITVDTTERTVTLGHELLNSTNIAIGGTGGYKIKLDEYDEYIPTDNSEGHVWQLTGTTTKTATYKRAQKEYYTTKADGTGITYTSAKDAANGTYITLNGIAADDGKELAVVNNIIGTRTTGDSSNDSFEAGVLIDDDNKTVYLKSNILPTTDKAAVTIATPKATIDGETNQNYTVKLEEGVQGYTKTDGTEYFTYENNAVVLKATFPNGYTATNGRVTYTAGGDVTLATLTGLDVSAASATTVTDVTTNYTAALTKLGLTGTVTLTTNAGTITGGTHAYTVTEEGEEGKETTRTQTDNLTAAQLAAIRTAKTQDANATYAEKVKKYLTDGNYLTFEEVTDDKGAVTARNIYVSEDILGTANVTVRGANINGTTNTYTLNLAEDYSKPADTDIWTYTNGTATYKTVTPKFYSVSNNTIQYTAQRDVKTLATINGLVGTTATTTYGTNASDQPYTDVSVASLTDDQRFIMTTTRTRTVTTTAGEGEDAVTRTSNVTDAAVETEFLTLNDEKVVTLTPEALSKRNVTITGTSGYTLALDENVQAPTQTLDANGDKAFTWTGTAGAYKSGATQRTTGDDGNNLTTDDDADSLQRNGGTTATMKANFQEGYKLNDKVETTRGMGANVVTTTNQTITYSAARNNVTLMTLAGIKTALGAVTTAYDATKAEGYELPTGKTLAQAQADARQTDLETNNVAIDAYFKRHVSVETNEDDTVTVYVDSKLLNQTNISVNGSTDLTVTELKLGNDVDATDKVVETVYGWNNLAYQSYNTAYYNDVHNQAGSTPTTAEANAKRQIVYNRQTNPINLATIAGLKAGIKMEDIADEVFDESTNTVTLNQAQLGTGTVRITTTKQGIDDTNLTGAAGSKNLFKLALGDVPSKAQSLTEEWVTTGTTATKKDYVKGYYTLNDATTTATTSTQEIRYTADGAATKTYATVSGLKDSNTTVSDVGGVITLGASQLGTMNVNVRNGAQAGDIDYKLAFDGTVTNSPDYSGDNNATWTNANKVTTFTAKTNRAYFTLSADEKTATYTRANTTVTARFTGDKTALVLGTEANAKANVTAMTAGAKTIDFTTALVGTNDKVTINVNGGMEFRNSSGKTLVGSGAADVITVTAGTVEGGGGNDTITAAGNNVVISGDAGNDVIELANVTGATFVYTNGHGNDTVKNFTVGTDTFKLGNAATTITSVTNENGNLLVKIGGGTVTLEGVGGTGDFSYQDSTGAPKTIAITAASADLAESADLLFDDNFVTNDTISDLVNTSIDTYSVGNLNTTNPLTGIAEQNEMVFTFAQEKNNK
ncbi:MAG: hypothetical protein IJT06_04830 [Selenomonadaceae bacterium]|nr:hypothetical protein [Selenomonadaceae bacterium]